MSNRSDNFNRANGALNGSTPSDGGSAWACTNGGSVSSNQMAFSGNQEYDALEAGVADVDVIATVAVLPSGFGRIALMARGSDVSNLWFGEARAGVTGGTAGTWIIFKREAGTNTTQVAGTGPALTIGSILRFNAQGDRFRFYHTPSGGSESLILDTGTGKTFNQTVTKHGFGGAFCDGTVRLDDLSIVDLAGGGGFVDNTNPVLRHLYGSAL